MIAAVLAARLLVGLCILAAEPAAEAEGLDALSYNQAQWKAAHNSIDRKETLAEQLEWNAAEPARGGCRGIELDLVLDPDSVKPGGGWVFGVQHGGAFRPDTPRLADCLRQVRSWIGAHPRHGVITLHLDLKREATQGEDGVFVKEIDGLLAKELGRERIFTPAGLKRGEATLLAGARKGWPTLAELRGKLILVFSGEDLDEPVARRRRAYAATAPGERLCFVDLDQRAGAVGGFDECDIKSPYFQEGSRVFLNLQLGRKDWTGLARAAHAQGFVTREWRANTEDSWRESRAAAINVLSTDRIQGEAWATVGPAPFARLEK